MTRRDKCHLVAKRAARLSQDEAAAAWFHLTGGVDAMGEKDVPKFRDILGAMRRATIFARQVGPIADRLNLKR